MYFRNLTQILNFENNGGGYSKEMPIAVQDRLVGVKQSPWFQDENSSYPGGFLELGVHISGIPSHFSPLRHFPPLVSGHFEIW